eukprot:1142366-Pelagomonas_calceolata.AAC.4
METCERGWQEDGCRRCTGLCRKPHHWSEATPFNTRHSTSQDTLHMEVRPAVRHRLGRHI